MQKSRDAAREGRSVRTLQEADFVLGVADEARLGALRFRGLGDDVFQAPSETAVPGLLSLARLRSVAERVLQGTESDDDFLAI